MLVKQRDLGACDACHIGKQKKKPHLKKLERNTKTPNQVVYADLLIPSKDNGTRFEVVLVIMDGFSRFVTLHMLTSKSSEVVNRHIKEYVLWAERQAGRHKVRQVLTRTLHVVYKVYQILTDKGGEFVNTEMEPWYKAHGIEHVLVGPKSSQLNLCERTHQSLVEMMKASMHDAGFPRSLWPEALRNAVYIKNRIYNKGTGGVPYEMLFGVKPDLHHVRKFGALAYVHVPVTPGRKKHHDNARLGFVLGYAEDVIGCKVYFPDNRTAKFVSDLRVAEDVMYRDRHEVTVEDDDLESLHFVQSGEIVEDDEADSTYYESTMECEAEGNTAAAPTVNEITAGPTVALEGGETCGAPSAAPNAAPCGEAVGYLSVLPSGSGRSRTDLREAYRATSASSLEDVGGVTAALPSEPAEIRSMQTEMQCELDELQSESQSELLTGSQDDCRCEPEQHLSVIGSPGTMASPSEGDVAAASDAASCDNSESVAGQCGSDVGDTEELDDGNAVAVEDELEDEEATTVASVCGPLTGKRQRDETPSEEIRVEQSAERQEPKRTRRTGLREYHERRRLAYLRDYVMNVANTLRVLDRNGRPIRASDVRVPRNRRESRRSKYREFFIKAELEEMAAMRTQHVLEEIAFEDVPKNAKPIKTRFVYDIKSDHQGYVIRFKARLVALGNYQPPGIDFGDTFSPVARMSSFRLMVGLAGALNLALYGGDTNTAYLNAKLGIRQYVQSIEGFPCDVDGHIYVVVKALYGLRQSGREWNTELNRWLLERGYERYLTEPCLYYRVEGEEIMLALVYVGDILVATKDEEQKKKLFEDLDKEYGLKDQGLLAQYLGVEVEQTADHIFINQSEYAREILTKFGYAEAHSVGNPMEVNALLVPLGDGEESDTSFPYREAVGMLMYLATSTRPDLAFALSQLSRFVAKPSSKHVGALKRVLRYLAGTVNYGITYDRQSGESDTVVLEGYCDSDWANDPETRRSTTGFMFTLAGGAVSWMARRQSIVALSTAEAEYVAACEATMEAVAESNILQEILPQKCLKLRIGIDNQAAHTMATNPTYSRRTRHIELRWHFVREQVERGVIELHKIRGDVNPADPFTKPLNKLRLQNMLGLVGIGIAK
ncbi:hypothetical protein PF010_g950 [Phytophthora fragariae]|uniref:Integrase catalytic domain-containing protein n=1 Tax=Phytophthora fragariae TaxID=53985 RepID=A0A6G0M1F6_9STRA|nr:hypothetical protein PF010_g950 [Phytophthora fragariae]